MNAHTFESYRVRDSASQVRRGSFTGSASKGPTGDVGLYGRRTQPQGA